MDIEISINLLSDPDGERLFTFMRDITERKRADAVGAALRIESGPGRGVQVIVEIPRRAA